MANAFLLGNPETDSQHTRLTDIAASCFGNKSQYNEHTRKFKMAAALFTFPHEIMNDTLIKLEPTVANLLQLRISSADMPLSAFDTTVWLYADTL
ncbi:hypothetical protein DQQ10_22125 [Pseudochryseolinea flava]|uniref:Uncharacterized protein n=1 Tax=Pseudochryseolinea flava TaxID=2059302 RepID=A0A364XWV8_9BACT|nr:hypothetical protein DQQ10_22125 [Pseudochryseolinea flava]